MRRLRRGRKKGGILLKLILITTILMFGFWYLNDQLNRTISTVINYQIRVYATRALNTAVLEELERMNLNYKDLVRLQTDEKHQVTAIETDAIQVSRMKANLANAIEEKLQEPEFEQVGIPLGTVTGSQWLSGYGPNINFRLIPLGGVSSTLENKFDSAGINQTRHQIMLHVELHFTAVIPGFSTEFTTNTNFCIAETIIVGPIPEAYTYVGDGNENTIDDINDYNANDVRFKKYVDDILD